MNEAPEVIAELLEENEKLKKELASQKDAQLRLMAEYDNFRKRTVKEKEASYGNGKADAVAKMLPIYDNLERALNQPTEDAAYKKGVEMTMTELEKIEYAKSLLLSNKRYSLPQVAEMLGYNDQYHFIRQFKTHTGVTPKEYRKIRGNLL